MPIFEYRCAACHHLEEVLQKHSDPTPATCPACGKHGSLAKEMSATSFQLKGGGWYKDLYASSAAPKDTPSATAPSTAATPTPSAAPETKSEAKPAKKDTTSGSSSGGSSSGGSSSGGSSSGGSSANSTAA